MFKFDDIGDDVLSFKSTSQKPFRKIRLAICCREKKMNSRPMLKILEWISQSDDIQILRMNDEMIMNKPIEEWIRCDVMISFYSNGFPLQKAIDYAEKYKPKMINDLFMQTVLWDRPSILERLKKRKIPIPKSFVVLRGDDKKRA
jgi:inositol hexakisphosphate/diphosphoinositol-pentakisphosphate kinase